MDLEKIDTALWRRIVDEASKEDGTPNTDRMAELISLEDGLDGYLARMKEALKKTLSDKGTEVFCSSAGRLAFRLRLSVSITLVMNDPAEVERKSKQAEEMARRRQQEMADRHSRGR